MGEKIVTSDKAYQIESVAGVVLGIYKGADEQEAYDSMCRDAGYNTSGQVVVVAPPSSRLIFTEVEAESKAVRTWSILSNGEDERINIELRRDGDRYRWYCPSNDDLHGECTEDTEVSEPTVERAEESARMAWGADCWGLIEGLSCTGCRWLNDGVCCVEGNAGNNGTDAGKIRCGEYETDGDEQTGWIACDYTEGDMLADVPHHEIRDTHEEAAVDAKRMRLDGVRWVGSDGYLYVDEQD